MPEDGALAAKLRHDLRTPINAILGYSQLLLEEADGSSSFSAAERRDLEGVAGAGRQLLSIVTSVLDAADLPRNLPLGLVRLRQQMQPPLSLAQSHLARLIAGHGAGAPGVDLRRIQSALVCLVEFVDTVEQTSSVCAGPDSSEPLAAAGLEARAPGPLCEAPSNGGTGTILLIDDEEANRTLLTRRLTRHGHAVLTAETGEAGIAMAAVHPVDVILLDVMMPGISGYEVLARLKQHAHLREIPVLMITAVDGSASVTRCIALGADDYLAKPFDPVVLAARVRACVTKKRAREFELAYLRGVAAVTEAAAEVESGRFTPSSLDAIASRSDALGLLARLFQRMAVEVSARERRLEEQVHQLAVAIDERKTAAQVQEIIESDYFRDLKARAHHFSARRAARSSR